MNVTDMLGTSIEPGNHVKHVPTGLIYRVVRVSAVEQTLYPSMEKAVFVKVTGKRLSKIHTWNQSHAVTFSTKNLLRCAPDGTVLVDRTRVGVLD